MFKLIEINGRGKSSIESLNFKVAALKLKVAGKTDKEAIAQAAVETGYTLTPSYTSAPGSHIYRFKKEISALITKNDAKTIEACKAAGLLAETADPVAAVETDAPKA